MMVFAVTGFKSPSAKVFSSIQASSRSFIVIGLLLLSSVAFARKEHYGQGLSVDLDAPYDVAVKAVQEISENGTIQGTWQYKGTSELDGATSAKEAGGFEPWKGQGAVFYKVRPKAIAPQNFYATGDQGTVAVRYIVESAGPKTSKLRIEAIFEEDDHHHTHPSDGQVENSEYTAITQKFEEFQQLAKKRLEAEAQDDQTKKVAEMQAALDRENADLNALKRKEQALQQRPAKAPAGEVVRIRTSSADLKASPYNGARTLQLLTRGQAVILLTRAGGWCRVQTAHGEQGWVFHQMLEGER